MYKRPEALEPAKVCRQEDDAALGQAPCEVPGRGDAGEAPADDGDVHLERRLRDQDIDLPLMAALGAEDQDVGKDVAGIRALFADAAIAGCIERVGDGVERIGRAVTVRSRSVVARGGAQAFRATAPMMA